MATAGKAKKLPSKVSVPSSDYYIPPVSLGVVAAPESLGEDVVGWIAALVLVGLMLPLLGMLYLDILEAKHEVKAQVEKIEKLRQKLEQKEREK